MIATRSYDAWGVMSDAAAVAGGAGGRFGYTGQAWLPEALGKIDSLGRQFSFETYLWAGSPFYLARNIGP